MKKIILILVLLAFSNYLYADGESLRPATQAEKVYTRTVLETIRKAVPESFAGFKLADATEPYEPEDVGENADKHPLVVDFYGSWNNEEKELEATQKMQQIGDTTGDISKSPQMLAKMKKKDEITAKMEQAAKNNDLAAIGRLSTELQTIAQEIDKGYAPAINAIPSEDNYKVRTSISVNELTGELSQSIYKEIAPVKGFKTFYYHDTEEGENKRADSVKIYMGNWSSSVDNGVYMLKLNIKNIPHTTVQSYVISVEGTKEYTQKFIDGLNFKMLTGLLK
jgi:hypothetical protein